MTYVEDDAFYPWESGDWMTTAVKRSLDLLSEEELLRIATEVPQPISPRETAEQQLRRFLVWEGIRPGRTAAIELHLLYYLYACWLAEHRRSPSESAVPEQIPPRAFGRILSKFGFRRKKARRRSDSRRCLAMDHASALRLKKWSKWLELPEYRRICQRRRRADRPDHQLEHPQPRLASPEVAAT